MQIADPHWTQYLAALLTPTVAVSAVVIGYRQWRTAQNKLKLDLFEKRLKIYEAVRNLIGSILRTGKTSPASESEFLQASQGAKWLFGPEVEKYVYGTLWPKVCDLWCLQEELNGLGVGPERTEKANKAADIKKWLLDQTKVLDAKFAPYLKLEH
jgi:hypothetical protein